MTTSTFRPRLVKAGRQFGVVAARGLYDVRAVHPERMPMAGPVIAVSNHVGFLDGPIVFIFTPRPLRFLVKRSYFSSAWGVLLRAMGQIPIDQNSAERSALMAAKDVLTAGGGVGIFPEGTRGGGTVETAQQGAAWLAQQTGAVIVPVAVLGTVGTGGRDSWPRLRSEMRVVVGEPFELPELPGVPGRQRLQLATEDLREHLAEHVAQAVRETGLSLPHVSADAAPSAE
ncbi:lysophospholipid acyltransferase family protein [Rudaeicoccus suwonensis]|uniref:1-acyl-sn-glycerol-3-phosphate acyltransferase n=1 Tax=Rudaeicoccus suwonensis TaxID=657409 RepID=A0A561EB76_9MICO|nr:lysophospholipid acyltransferase family protein [Rudaeicoccus suwonensis]TWE12861.1 1-acyl-sn-glycerol-3-phosphate acyltransferase [Rudaeicoccus suwonensis]